MVFLPHSSLPDLPPPPTNLTVEQFLTSTSSSSSYPYTRQPVSKSRNPFTCGLSNKTYTSKEVIERVDCLSRSLSKRLKFDPREGTEWDRVVCVFSLNTIDYIPLTLALHRLHAIPSSASAAFTPPELTHQLKSSTAKALFTCVPLLPTALEAAKEAGIPEENVFILPMEGVKQEKEAKEHKNVEELVEEGKGMERLAEVKLMKGEAVRRVAYLMFSSGTSGLPKAVMLTHHNIISNILQTTLMDHQPRLTSPTPSPRTILGLLPFGHIFALTLVGLVSLYRGDEVIVLPKFELLTFLKAIQEHKIQELKVVPPVLVQMAGERKKCAEFDLSSVRSVFSGGAPLGEEVIREFEKMYPEWRMMQGYGMTESSPLQMCSLETDLLLGSSGLLIPGQRAKLLSPDGNEITDYESRGELLVSGPNIVAGYLNNEKANAETFVYDEEGRRWLRTGDEVLVRKSEKGTEHFFVVDRIKELIKVKGYQVAPAELESHLLSHPSIHDCAVISVPDPRSGEAPKAFIVKSPDCPDAASKSDDELRASINKHVEDSKPKYKWLKGGIEFIKEVPKSPSGKILRKILRERERERRREEGAKL